MGERVALAVPFPAGVYACGSDAGRTRAAPIISVKVRTTVTSLKTIASFCEYTAEMLADVADRDELLKRHRDSLVRLRASLVTVLDGPVST